MRADHTGTAVLLVILGQFVVSVVRRADGGAVAVAVGQMRTCRIWQAWTILWALAEVRSWARPRNARGSHGEVPYGVVDDLHIHAVLLVLSGVVRLARPDAVNEGPLCRRR